MSQGETADGVRFERIATPPDLDRIVGRLPAGLRFDISRDLDERGKSLQLHSQTHRVLHLHCEAGEIVVVTFSMSTLLEAAILLTAIKTLPGPLDEKTAIRLYRQATFRDEFPVEPRRRAPAISTWRRGGTSGPNATRAVSTPGRPPYG